VVGTSIDDFDRGDKPHGAERNRRTTLGDVIGGEQGVVALVASKDSSGPLRRLRKIAGKRVRRMQRIATERRKSVPSRGDLGSR